MNFTVTVNIVDLIGLVYLSVFLVEFSCARLSRLDKSFVK